MCARGDLGCRRAKKTSARTFALRHIQQKQMRKKRGCGWRGMRRGGRCNDAVFRRGLSIRHRVSRGAAHSSLGAARFGFVTALDSARGDGGDRSFKDGQLKSRLEEGKRPCANGKFPCRGERETRGATNVFTFSVSTNSPREIFPRARGPSRFALPPFARR